MSYFSQRQALAVWSWQFALQLLYTLIFLDLCFEYLELQDQELCCFSSECPCMSWQKILEREMDSFIFMPSPIKQENLRVLSKEDACRQRDC